MIVIKPTENHYNFYGNVQIYRNGSMFDIINEKDVPEFSEFVTIKDYKSRDIYKSNSYNYKRARHYKRLLVWCAFNGRIPKNKRVVYIDDELSGKDKFALDNLKLIPSVSKETRKKVSVTAQKRRAMLFSKIVKLADAGKTIEEVCKKLKIPYEHLIKVVNEHDGNMQFLFKRSKIVHYIVSKFFEGKKVSYIGTKKKMSSKRIISVIERELNISDIKWFAHKIRMTMRILNEEGFTQDKIKKIFLEELKKWQKD